MLYHDSDQTVPIRTSTLVDHRKHHVTLPMITDGNEIFHYLSFRVTRNSLSDFKLTGYIIWTGTNFCHQVWTISLKIYTMMVLIVSNTLDTRSLMAIRTFLRRVYIHISI